MKREPFLSDVIIVGGGAAGLYAAIAAKIANPRLKVTLLTAYEIGSGGCSKKTHGINAAINEKDNWELHLKDTIEGGGGINNIELSKILCAGIIERIRELESWGVRFEKEGSAYNVGYYGGSTIGRSIHWFDITGLEIVDELKKRTILNGCHVKENRWVLELLSKDSRCHGVITYNRETSRIELYYAKAVVLATGGGACVYPISSISSDKLASGIIMGYNAGLTLVDMEMVQFHPTGILIPGTIGNGSLLEEEMRSQGGMLLNKHNKRYMYDYDKRGELATRDIVSRSSYLEIMEDRGSKNQGVFFDISKLNKEILIKRLPKTLKRLRSCGVDLLEQDIVEVSPTAHFLMGGLAIDGNCETPMKGLFVCGEDAGGIHGGNRLGGNGVAEALVFGFKSGRSAGVLAEKCEYLDLSLEPKAISYFDLSRAEIKRIDSYVKKMMWKYVGPLRKTSDLYNIKILLQELKSTLFKNKLKFFSPTDTSISEKIVSGIIAKNKLDLALIITTSASVRMHSLGAHYLLDESKEARDTSKMYNVLVKRDHSGNPETKIEYCHDR